MPILSAALQQMTTGSFLSRLCTHVGAVACNNNRMKTTTTTAAAVAPAQLLQQEPVMAGTLNFR